MPVWTIMIVLRWNGGACRVHSVYWHSQSHMALHCNTVSHWQGAYTEWSMLRCSITRNSDARGFCCSLFRCGCITRLRLRVPGPVSWAWADGRLFTRSRVVEAAKIGKFDMRFGSSAAEMPVKFQSDQIIITPCIAASRLHEILR